MTGASSLLSLRTDAPPLAAAASVTDTHARLAHFPSGPRPGTCVVKPSRPPAGMWTTWSSTSSGLQSGKSAAARAATFGASSYLSGATENSRPSADGASNRLWTECDSLGP